MSTQILIIEDDVWMAEQFERTLKRHSYSCRSVGNGPTAMEIIDKKAPDVVILDMLLAGGTAITLLHELQSYTDTAMIPVIMCTNLAAAISLKDVAPYGVKRILDKTTMHPDDIVAAVRSVTV